MTRNAIEVRGLSKRYRLGESATAFTSLRDVVSSWGRRSDGEQQEVWSLRDVSFDVAQGAALGVVGRNGAGKSTLLKLLTRITAPTEGYSRTRGRVGSLLEVGTGFHPELTGRENIMLNGALLGMSRAQTRRRFDEIVDFSGVARFLDTPVKRYSSGMYLRLAFSVAAHLEADILLVDEVLAVGDQEFQRRCIRKMAEVEGDGRTVVFVSHDLDAVARLCPQVLWLDGGRARAQGPTGQLLDAYLRETLSDAGSGRVFDDDPAAAVALRSVTLRGPSGHTGGLRADEPVTVHLEVDVRTSVPGLDVAVAVSSARGTQVIDEAWSEQREPMAATPGRYCIEVQLPAVLVPGDYPVSVWIGSAYEALLWEPDAALLRLQGTTSRLRRLVQLHPTWLCRREDGSPPTDAPAA